MEQAWGPCEELMVISQEGAQSSDGLTARCGRENKKTSKTALLLLQVVVGPGTTSPASFSQPSPCFLSTAAFFLHFFLRGLETCLSVHHGAPYIHPAPP